MEATLQWANASQVTAHLWVGGDLEVTDDELAASQLDELDAAGITDIVDLRLEWSDEDWVTAAKPHIRYRWLGVDDAGQRMPDEWFDAGTEHVLTQLSSGGTGPGALPHGHQPGPLDGVRGHARTRLGPDRGARPDPAAAADRVRRIRRGRDRLVAPQERCQPDRTSRSPSTNPRGGAATTISTSPTSSARSD